MKFLILLAVCVTTSYACSCAPHNSTNEAFCDTEYVSHVKVLSRSGPRSRSQNNPIYFNVEHICVYRKPTGMKELSRKIVTAPNDGLCGVDLTIGKEYLLGGTIDNDGSPRAALCGIFEEWNNVEDKDALKTYKCKEVPSHLY